jgi:hypothetical protein
VSKLPGLDRFPDPLWRHPSYDQVGSPSNPELYGNSRTASGDSRTTPELGECIFICKPSFDWLMSSRSYLSFPGDFPHILHQYGRILY